MPGYDARYDYGLRGRFPEAPGQRSGPRPFRGGMRSGPRERRAAPRGPRVTERYNRDYVFGGRSEDAYPRNYNPYGGDRPGQIVDERGYRPPYLSIGGTRTYRGIPEPIRYDQDYDRYDLDIHPFR
jgi:hypothetical protein